MCCVGSPGCSICMTCSSLPTLLSVFIRSMTVPECADDPAMVQQINGDPPSHPSELAAAKAGLDGLFFGHARQRSSSSGSSFDPPH
jgi:hypothetical protein